MNEPDFDAFLQGSAEDKQHRVCEELLANPETIVNVDSTVADDSLLSALRMAGESIPNDHELESLVERVEKLVPRHSITTDELSRFLDSGELPDELGKVDRFRIIEILASGGMGLVFRAIDPNLDREVCIKMLSPRLEFDSEAISRFERETREAARMNSERIVTVLEVGRQRGLPYFVMPMLEGMSLRSMLDVNGPVPPDRALQITRQLAEGLQYMHDQELLHRDIKPDNLWLTKTGDVVLLDFGLTRSTNESIDSEAPITCQGTVIGTPSYMSPEQVKGKELDQRSDLFSVGVVLVEMLTGQSPFKKANLFSTMMSVAGDEVEMDQFEEMRKIPVGLQELAQRLLHKIPGDRVDSATSLIGIMNQIESSPKSMPATLPVKNAGGSWKLAVAACLFGMLLSAMAFAAWFATDKGTLVVSTNDPDVEVKIAGEQVNVHDPISRRDYQIKIGETPLPSGVYQLETEAENGGLVFSSQTIEIRRGAKTIVSVELVDSKPSVDAKSTVGSKSNNESVEDLPWADTTRKASAHGTADGGSFVQEVRELPSLSFKDADLDISSGLFDRAVVQNPKKLDGVEAWTIERLEGVSLNLERNISGTLYAGVEREASTADGFLRIFDSRGELVNVIPVSGRTARVKWSANAEDLIAVSSLVRDVEKKGVYRYAITVWQITPSGVRLLRSIRASSGSFNWNAGYRIIYFVDDKLSAYRLDSGEKWSMPEASGREFLYDGAVSPNGRFVATYSMASGNPQISIWDLKSGKFMTAVPAGIGATWGQDSQYIAVDCRRTFGGSRAEENTLEIWDMVSQQKTKSFSKPNRESSCISPSLRMFAIKSKSGEVVVTDTSTRREQRLPVPNEFTENSAGDFSIQWTRDDRLKVRNRKRVAYWMRGEFGLSGRFGKVMLYSEIDPPRSLQLELAHVVRTATGELDVFGRLRNEGNESSDGDDFGRRGRRGNESNENFQVFRVRLNLADNSISSISSFANMKWFDRMFRLSIFGNEVYDSPAMLSPSGRFVLAWDASPKNDAFGVPRRIRVVDLENSDRVLPVGNLNSISGTDWSHDGRLLLVRGVEHGARGRQDVCVVIDLERWEERVVEGMPQKPATNFYEWNDGFVFCFAEILNERTRVSKWKVGYIGSKKGAKFQALEGEFSSIYFSDRQGSDIFLEGKRFVENEAKDDASQPTVFFKLSTELTLTEIPRESYPGRDSWKSFVSYDGKYRIGQLVDDNSNEAKPQRPRFSIYRAASSGKEGQDTNTSLWEGEITGVRWHPTANSAIWRRWSNDSLQLFTPEKMAEPIHYSGVESATPIEGGWLIVEKQKIKQLDFDGEVVAELSFDEDDSGALANPTWLFSDGFVMGSNKSLHIVFETDQEFRVLTPSEFMRVFPNAKLPQLKPTGSLHQRLEIE